MNKQDFLFEKLTNFVTFNKFILEEMKTKNFQMKKERYDEFADGIQRLDDLLKSDDPDKFEKVNIFIEYEFSGLYQDDDFETFSQSVRSDNYKNYIITQMGSMGLSLLDIQRLQSEYELVTKYSLYLECFCSTLFD